MPVHTADGLDGGAPCEEKQTPISPEGDGRGDHCDDPHEIGLLDIVIFDEITKNSVLYR